MANMKVLLLLFLAVSVQFSVCLGDDVVDQAKAGAQQAQEKTESWAGWAYDKVTSNLGLKHEEKPEPPVAENMKMQTNLQSESFARENREKLNEEMANIKAKTVDAFEGAKEKLGAASEGAKAHSEAAMDKVKAHSEAAMEKTKAHSEAAMEKAKQAAKEINPAKGE